MIHPYKTHAEDMFAPAGHIFVFGSSINGHRAHEVGGSVANNYEVLFGCGRGPTGLGYAIPTYGYGLEVLPLMTIGVFVQEFVHYAAHYREIDFFLTRVGCTPSGYTDAEIAPMFRGVSTNVNIPQAWAWYLAGKGRNQARTSHESGLP